ncbi:MULTISPECIES: AbrB/MazE/SpoVT family DNA-binding domain-containing protein [Pontibacillus]|uniref:AbrB/MazE/SpoVT family DNA-binding domain-containing protein n=1 Tax=Pontibacillus chungwhensis TaxID=265426 RepID=A0ABY8V219_9BACI|nr:MULTISPECIES: AbrB/MazE/SpoVT family DNA-binding domain-containing protein [Pontibacillus]MCD5324407.1 AbrB/MazE/SpoVT family DNA-binding domain-containing protein [Pontibacillus sp. HN14]WIF99297.1 AbrB/MazE/SpoVT family DNA-binding domain-containing protein [Pontibacillus chungwhensis]
MSTKIQKLGDGLAIRIPPHVAEQLQVQQGSEVEIKIEGGIVTLQPVNRKLDLNELLSEITPENRHDEIDVGSEGNEKL